jgi:hypothetical protein
MPLSLKRRLRAATLAAALGAVTLAFAAMVGPGVAAASSTANTALINGDSITTLNGITKGETPISLEQFAAEQVGYSVKVVTGAEWEAMTAEEFATYQVLIVGDHKCSSTPESVNKNAATWGPVVMGKSVNTIVGNRALAGIDPEWHYANGAGHAAPTNPADPTTAGAEHLVQDGIAFAGAVAGATGIYFDTSCNAPEADITTLDQLTAEPGHWKSAHPACDAKVQQIATNPAFETLTDEMIQGWGCSSHVAFPGFPTDWNPFAVVIPKEGTVETETACGIDPSTKEKACGQPYILLAGKGIVAESELVLTPKVGSDRVGGEHTVTATLTEEKTKPVPGAVVSFVVIGQNAGVTGTCTTTTGAPNPTCATDETGGVRFTYKDINGLGEDTINAAVTLTVRDRTATEHATATETWTPAPAVTPPAPKKEEAKSSVLPIKVAAAPKGTARAASVRGCIAQSSYLAWVRGTSIASVTFSLDGHAIKTLRKPTSGSTFATRVKVHAGSAHRLAMRVVFTAASKTPSATFQRTLARCAAVHKAVLPRFTG